MDADWPDEALPHAPRQRFVALVAYDGSDFFGFQAQAGVPTIQGALEQALGRFFRLDGRLSGAGRTDTGVHARGQVVAVSLAWQHGPDDLLRAWNAHLPAAIAIRSLVIEPSAPSGQRPFHPRYSALSRTYRYTVVEQAEGSRRSPLDGRYAHVEAGTLNLAAMQQAAHVLIGSHDFVTFGRAPSGESTVRHLLAADWCMVDESLPPLAIPRGSRLVFTVTANAFLQRMVRRLVGTLLEVGRGRLSVSGFADALAARDGRRSAPPAFAGGLVLEQVTYAPEWGLHLGPGSETKVI